MLLCTSDDHGLTGSLRSPFVEAPRLRELHPQSWQQSRSRGDEGCRMTSSAVLFTKGLGKGLKQAPQATSPAPGCHPPKLLPGTTEPDLYRPSWCTYLRN